MRRRIFFWFVCLLLSGMGHNFVLAFHPDSENIEWPTCDELRTLWLTLKRLTQHGEITNEIPLIPADLLLNKLQGHHHHRSGHSSFSSGQRRHDFNALLPIPDNLDRENFLNRPSDVLNQLYPQNVLQPVLGNPNFQHKIKSHGSLENEGFFGSFEDGFQPEPVSPFTNPQNPTNELESGIGSEMFGALEPDTRYENDKDETPIFDGIYGLREDVGSFGGFSDEDETQVYHPTNIRTVKVDNSGSDHRPTSIGSRFEIPAIRIEEEDSCEYVEQKSCFTSDDCACVGWATLHCITGKCLPKRIAITSNLPDIGTWHNGPLLPTQLGKVSRRRRRGKRSKVL